MTYFEVCSWVSVVALHACVKYRRITDIIQKSKIASRRLRGKERYSTSFLWQLILKDAGLLFFIFTFFPMCAWYGT